MREHALEKIYIPSAESGNPTEFKTKVDILLKQWAERVLPMYAVQVSLHYNFSTLSFLSPRIISVISLYYIASNPSENIIIACNQIQQHVARLNDI